MSVLSKADLHRIFQKLDRNKDGLVSLDELNWLLELIGFHLSLEELDALMGNSCLNYGQFLSFYDSISKHSGEAADDDDDDESDLVKAFSVFDLNGDGVITCEELQCVLTRLGLLDESRDRDCTSMINVYDTNMDGVLDFHEFKNMLLKTSS